MSVRTEPAAPRPETTARRDWVTAWGLIAGLLVVLVLPSADFAVFAGIPITSAPAYFGLVWLAVPLLWSGEVRRRFVSVVGFLGSKSFRFVVALMLVTLIAKVVLLVGAPSGGFSACFRSLVPAAQQTGVRDLGLPARRCELSYANPLGRFGEATRIDSTIDFGEAVGGRDWGLDFFNSTRFNYWPQWTGVPNRQYLPFGVVWRGEIASDRGRHITVRYVGQGSVSLDGATRSLPPSYDHPVLVGLSAPAGRHRLSVRYEYTREVIQPRRPTAYAGIAVAGGSKAPLTAASVSSAWKVVATVADVAIAVLLMLVLAAVVLATRGRILVALLFGAAAGVAIRLPRTDLLIGLLEFSAFALAASWVIRRRACLMTGLLTLYTSVLTIELERARHELMSFGHVVLRTGGDDWLTYESQAHVVLAGSLRGGESVFAYTPSMRYVLAAGHAIFGNGDGRLSVVALTAIVTSFLGFALVVVSRAGAQPIRPLKLSGAKVVRLIPAGGLLLATFAGTLLISGDHAVAITRDPLSEPLTWALIPSACALFLVVRTRWAFLAATTLCAVALVTRIDQGVGLIALVGCGVLALVGAEKSHRQALRNLRPTAVTAVCVFAAIALLPALHNLYYGNRPRLVVDPGPGAVNYAVPVADLPRICCSSTARSKFARQLRLVSVVRQHEDNVFVGTIRLIQVLWLAALALTALRWKRLSPLTRLVALSPLAFVLPQMFLAADSYYPRHIVADYLVMALASTYAFGVYRAELDGSRRE